VRNNKYRAPTLQEDITTKKIGEERISLKATALNGKVRASRKDPPAGNKNQAVGNKRKSPNNTATPNPK